MANNIVRDYFWSSHIGGYRRLRLVYMLECLVAQKLFIWLGYGLYLGHDDLSDLAGHAGGWMKLFRAIIGRPFCQ